MSKKITKKKVAKKVTKKVVAKKTAKKAVKKVAKKATKKVAAKKPVKKKVLKTNSVAESSVKETFEDIPSPAVMAPTEVSDPFEEEMTSGCEDLSSLDEASVD